MNLQWMVCGSFEDELVTTYKEASSMSADCIARVVKVLQKDTNVCVHKAIFN